ncbi:MAG: peroxide stress protein YaaA, partial [Pseudomonadota bacterium]
MDISPALADLNVNRYSEWQPPFSPENAKQAVLAFQGDVYQGLRADQFSDSDFDWAQDHLRILSGLYGLLRPLDLIQAYRLEMGTRLPVRRKKDLYDFWDIDITQGINEQLAATQSTALVNLASQEYFKSVKPTRLDAPVITPRFLDRKGDDYKMIGFFAKRARGTMSAWIIKNRVTDAYQLDRFDGDGYQFRPEMSSEHDRVYTRESLPE